MIDTRADESGVYLRIVEEEVSYREKPKTYDLFEGILEQAKSRDYAKNFGSILEKYKTLKNLKSRTNNYQSLNDRERKAAQASEKILNLEYLVWKVNSSDSSFADKFAEKRGKNLDECFVQANSYLIKKINELKSYAHENKSRLNYEGRYDDFVSGIRYYQGLLSRIRTAEQRYLIEVPIENITPLKQDTTQNAESNREKTKTSSWGGRILRFGGKLLIRDNK